MKKTLIFLFLTVGLISQAAFNHIKCYVGDLPISEQDILRRTKVSDILYPGSNKKYVGLGQLIKGFLSIEVLKSLGHKIENTTLDNEAKRINNNTKNPELLNEIIISYGNDKDSYLKTFVGIVYAERILYNEIFLKSKEIHQEQHHKADNFLKTVMKNPETFETTAEKSGLKTMKFIISAQDGIKPYGEKKSIKTSGSDTQQAKRLINFISLLKEGEIYSDIIEWQEGYQIIRLIQKDGEDYVIDSVNIPKRSYDEWFWEKASSIPVKIYDKNLEKELLKEVLWAKQLKLTN
jgi:hypothetical protein